MRPHGKSLPAYENIISVRAAVLIYDACLEAYLTNDLYLNSFTRRLADAGANKTLRIQGTRMGI
jgi:hypothetical protein